MTTPPSAGSAHRDGHPHDAGWRRRRGTACAVADHLLAQRHDGIIVNGTTGESATLTSDESIRVIEIVAGHVGDRAQIVAGWAPMTPPTASIRPAARRRSVPRVCSSSPRTTTSRPSRDWSPTSARSPTRPTCRSSSTTSRPHRHPDRHRDPAPARRPPAHRRGQQGRQGRPLGRDPRHGRDGPALVLRRRRPQPRPPRPGAVGIISVVVMSPAASMPR